jgi:hypothetical protein
MSRAQTIRFSLQVVGAVAGMLLFLLLPFRTWVDAFFGIAAFLIIGGIGERYFRRHATPEEIRADLEARKDDS